MYTFLAKWFRARNILRWPLQTNLIRNDDASHSFECAVVAHMIGTINNVVFGGDLDPNKLAALAIFHEGGEVGGFGDLNSIAKNKDPETKKAIKRIEHIFECELVDSLPDELKSSYKHLIVQDKQSIEGKLVKASDDICAYVEASKELAMGNYEYTDAAPNCKTKVDFWCKEFECVAYFCSKFLPQLNQTIEKDFS